MVGRGGPKSGVRAVHRCAKPLAGVALGVVYRVVTGQGIVRVRACDTKRNCIVGESGLAPVGHASQGLEFGDFAGELGEDGALDELEQHQHLMLLDMVLANKGRQEVVEPKQDRAQGGHKWRRCMPTDGQRGSGSQLGRPNRGIPWRRWDVSCAGLGVHFQLLHGGADQLVIALFRHLWKFLNDFAVLDDGQKIAA